MEVEYIMKHSETMSDIAKALAKFQGEVRDPAKDTNNPFFKSKYVPLDGLLNAVRPVLAANGLSFMQFLGGDGQTITVTTLLLHESGEWIESEPFPLKPVKTDPQAYGSACTYGKRYSLSAALGIGWQEDDDGNKASQKPSQNTQQAAGAPKPKQANTSPQDEKKAVLQRLTADMKQNGMGGDEMKMLLQKRFGKDSSKELTLAEARDLAQNYMKYWDELMQQLGKGDAA